MLKKFTSCLLTHLVRQVVEVGLNFYIFNRMEIPKFETLFYIFRKKK